MSLTLIDCFTAREIGILREQFGRVKIARAHVNDDLTPDPDDEATFSYTRTPRADMDPDAPWGGEAWVTEHAAVTRRRAEALGIDWDTHEGVVLCALLDDEVHPWGVHVV